MQKVSEFVDGDVSVTLEQRANGKFRVVYGLEIHDNLNYSEAAREYGFCVMHSLCCSGKIKGDPDDLIDHMEKEREYHAQLESEGV